MENLPVTILYFPYVVLGIATLLFMMDRPFVLVIFNNSSMDELYKMLVVEDDSSKGFDVQRERRELQHISAASSSFFFSYLLRTLLSLVSSAVLLVLLVLSLEDFQASVLHCRTMEQWYECAGHPVHFYKTILILVISLLGLYFLLNLYNLAWVVAPGARSLGRTMEEFRRVERGQSTTTVEGGRRAGWRELKEFYYSNRDVRLLLDLLCSSSGPSLPLRSLATLSPSLTRSAVVRPTPHPL